MYRSRIITALAMTAVSITGVYAQSAVDAYSLVPTQLRGSARFVAMGGAFTSLGGDISTMTQNPAGIGVYRHSDLGLTFDISIRNYSAATEQGKFSNRQTKGYFDNFGYIGAVKLNGPMRTFNWGVSYNRLSSFDRRFNGYNRPTDSSLSNYIAGFTDGVDSGTMLFDDSKNYNPYLDSNNDWLSILAYSSMMINNVTNETTYTGLFQPGTEGDAEYSVEQHGYVDEYNIDFGGNVDDVIYWGIGVGIVDMSMTQSANYSESMANALIYTGDGMNLSNGNAGFGLYNYKYISGSGANLKVGIIARPVEMLRLGFAIHTPTWMHLTSSGFAEVDYNYTPDRVPEYAGQNRTLSGNEYTDNFEYNWRLNTPWRFMVGASLLIGNSAIVSVDYERVAYDNMKVKYGEWNQWGQDFVTDDRVESAIKETFKASNIIRAGIEYRLTRRISARLGFNYQTTNVREEAKAGRLEINTAGTDPSYTFDNDTYNICAGLGYRYKAWYVDLTYQHTTTKGSYHAYTPYTGVTSTPSANLTTNINNIVVSTGFKF